MMNREHAMRPEIQGLRALAVGLVLIFHIWPSALAGGFIGVDVFFVISGYLITGLLVRAALRDGRISLIDFYSRRARRLLPAATAVLATTFAGMFVFLPESRWGETAIQIAASALYVENWVLAWLSVDYLGAEDAASPVMHYWSLSIEEQFYFVWPLVMVASIFIARRMGLSLRRPFAVGLSIIFVCSLAASILLTAQEPAQAYFVTHTRLWELALGGLLALTHHRIHWMQGRAARAWVAIIGIAAILWSAFTYSPATAFPGVAALVPTFGTALVILAGDVRLGFFRGLNTRLLIWIGDRSYSIYLWHWPLIVFYTVHQEIGLMDGIGLIALTLVLSHLSYEYIEQRYRHARTKGEWKPLGYGLASIAACVAATGLLHYSVASQAIAYTARADPRYPGPAALLAAATVPEGVTAIPALAALKHDLPVTYLGDRCHETKKGTEPTSCMLGNPDGARTMVVIGDSHAAQWVPALERIAHANDWRLMTFTKSSCAFSRVQVRLRDKPYSACMEWRENVIAEIRTLRPDLVFVSQSRYNYIPRETMLEGLRSVWQEMAEAGARVIPIHDTPAMPFQPGDCLALGNPENCTAPRSKVEARNIFTDAASPLEGIGVIDMTDGICDPATCRTIVGNMIVWRDKHHLTATYAAALAPYLAQQAGLPFPGLDVPATGTDKNSVVADTISARLTCSAAGQDKPIDRNVELQFENGEIAYRYGDWKEQKERYDLWKGTITDGSVSVTGHYVAGSKRVKPLSLTGTLVDGHLRVEGKRGPRDCILSAEWPGPQT